MDVRTNKVTGEKEEILLRLTYKDEGGNFVTYIHDPDDLKDPTPHYVFSQPEQWERGQSYKVGDTMSSNGYVFRCLRAHTTGTTSRTRDPSLRSNKSTWEVIGYVDGSTIGEYSSTVRYAEGLKVVYKGKVYARTDFNLVGGQVPYENSDSDYWLLLD